MEDGLEQGQGSVRVAEFGATVGLAYPDKVELPQIPAGREGALGFVNVVLGRSGKNEIGASQVGVAVKDRTETVSRLHCKLRLARADHGGLSVLVNDLGSKHGTWHKDSKGDWIEIEGKTLDVAQGKPLELRLGNQIELNLSDLGDGVASLALQ